MNGISMWLIDEWEFGEYSAYVRSVRGNMYEFPDELFITVLHISKELLDIIKRVLVAHPD